WWYRVTGWRRRAPGPASAGTGGAPSGRGSCWSGRVALGRATRRRVIPAGERGARWGAGRWLRTARGPHGQWRRRGRRGPGIRVASGFARMRGGGAAGLNRCCRGVILRVHDGTWRSPVAHLNGVQGVAGSNPAVPTRGKESPPTHYAVGGFVRVGMGSNYSPM